MAEDAKTVHASDQITAALEEVADLLVTGEIGPGRPPCAEHLNRLAETLRHFNYLDDPAYARLAAGLVVSSMAALMRRLVADDKIPDPIP